MSTPYNNQWLLGRSRWRRRRHAAGSGARRQPPAPLREEPHARQPASGTVRKQPRWIDRDT
jgi:hypothetical protein